MRNLIFSLLLQYSILMDSEYFYFFCNKKSWFYFFLLPLPNICSQYYVLHAINIKILMKIEDLNNYYDNLCKIYSSNEEDFVMNNDRAHNAFIESFMLDKSTVINMYCGEMSVFREGFYNHINQDHNDDLAKEEIPLGDSIKEKVIESLRSFINRSNTLLNIYFERFDRKYLRDLIDYRVFTDGINSGKIRLFKLDDNLFLKNGMSHISYTDTNIVRMERNQDTHEATCAINYNSEVLDKIKSTFDSMSLVGEEIKLN